jgi:hypothetical protein
VQRAEEHESARASLGSVELPAAAAGRRGPLATCISRQQPVLTATELTTYCEGPPCKSTAPPLSVKAVVGGADSRDDCAAHAPKAGEELRHTAERQKRDELCRRQPAGTVQHTTPAQPKLNHNTAQLSPPGQRWSV